MPRIAPVAMTQAFLLV